MTDKILAKEIEAMIKIEIVGKLSSMIKRYNPF